MLKTLATSLGSALLVAVVSAGIAHADAAREDGSRFRRWEVTQSTLKPAEQRTITVEVHDGSGWTAATRWGRKHRYNISAKLGGRWFRRVGAATTFKIRADQRRIPIRVRDRQGAQYDTVIELDDDAAEVLVLTSTWSPPVYRGRFVNTTHRKCGKRGRRIWRLGVQAAGDLNIGEAVKIRPGRSERGPILPDGDYDVRVEMWRRGRWHDRPTQRLTVAGAKWRFDPGCDVQLSTTTP